MFAHIRLPTGLLLNPSWAGNKIEESLLLLGENYIKKLLFVYGWKLFGKLIKITNETLLDLKVDQSFCLVVDCSPNDDAQ